MCQHGASTRIFIKEFIYELYPSIQFQFVLASSYNNSTAIQHPEMCKIYDPLKKLQSEFQALVTYEMNIVFPSVLKVFNHTGHHKIQLLDIADLQQVVINKEQQILQIASELANELPDTNITDEHTSIKNLVDFIRNDFVIRKMEWNNLIQDRLSNCACFMKFNNVTQ